MRIITAEWLTAEAFAPYGDVLVAPVTSGRAYFDAGLANARPHAAPSLSIARIPPVAALPLVARQMERHAHSSQSFMPVTAARFLVVVAPDHQSGGPDVDRVRAFLAQDGQGVTYRQGVWHHPMSVVGHEAQFTVVMWRDGGADDEEFVDLAEPFQVRLPG